MRVRARVCACVCVREYQRKAQIDKWEGVLYNLAKLERGAPMGKLTHEQKLLFAQKEEEREAETSAAEKALSYPVRKSNDMIQKSRYSLTLREQRLLLYAISKIKEDDDGTKRYKISIREAARICGQTDKIGKLLIDNVFESFATLRDKGFTIFTDRGTKVHCAFIEHPEQDKEGNIEYNFDKYIVPYLFRVKKQFTQYDLGTVVKMRSTYGIRLYELLKSFQYLGGKRILLPELRERLGAEEKSYDKYSLLKKYVLEPALNDIKNTDLRVDYVEMREGKKVVGINFIISRGTEYIEG